MIRFAISLLSMLVLTAAVASAQNDWKDYVDDPATDDGEAVIEDNPEWAKYEFDLPLANSSDRLSFSDIARQGQPFVLYWWLADCPMCHLQMPFVQQLHNLSEEHELELQVYGICIDSRVSSGLEYLEDKKISFPNLMDERARHTRGAFKVDETGTPLAYIFGADGLPLESIEGFRNNFSTSVLKLLEITVPEDAS